MWYRHERKKEKPFKIRLGYLIVGLIEHCVIPNLVIDEYATEIAKQNVQDAFNVNVLQNPIVFSSS